MTIESVQEPLFELPDDVPGFSEQNGEKDAKVLIESWEAAKKRINAQDLARSAVQERSLTPQEELGGGPYKIREDNTPTAKRLDDAIRGSEDWHIDIIDAVERFGLNDLNDALLDDSQDTDRLKYLLHVVKFMQSATSHSKQIRHVEGDVSLKPCINGFVDNASARQPEEMMEYADKIDQMLKALSGLGLEERLNKIYRSSGRKSTLNKCLENVDFRSYQVEFFVDPKTKLKRLKQVR